MLLRVMYLVSIKIDLLEDLNYIPLAVSLSKYIHYKKMVKKEISLSIARFCDTRRSIAYLSSL